MLHGRGRGDGATWRRLRAVVLVGEAVLLALAIDWVLVPRSYPVGAAYGVALLLAAHLLSARAVIVVTAIALALSVISNALQGAPLAAWLADDASLLVLGTLAWLLARQREAARVARLASEASQRQIGLTYEAARALAEATTLETAGAGMLASIGHQLDWTYGALWYLDEPTQALRCLATWHAPDHRLSGFDERTRALRFEPGVGLPGRVWTSGEPLWVADVQTEVDFPRGDLATQLGLHTAFCFPIRRAGEILGVIEFLDAQHREPDPELLTLMDAVGAQIGLFLDRRQAEAQAAYMLERESVARRQADEAVELRDQFLASASHDLRGPLTTLRGYAGIARHAIEAQESARALTALTNIDAGTKRLASALDELLDLAQLQAGQQLGLRLQSMDLVELVRRVASDQQVSSDAVAIDTDYAVSEVWGMWDAARLERALANLVSNAVKYSPSGGRVSVAVRLESAASTSWAIVEVRDRGAGIPAADLPHIFERFRRASNVSKQTAGTGLGLPGAREIVHQHGGDISVETEEGYGSTFTVRLPLARSAD